MKRFLKRALTLMMSVLLIYSGAVTMDAHAASPSVSYRTHVHEIGWMGYVSNGATSGTTGQSRSMQAIRLKLANVSGDITYRTHVQNIGWMSWVKNNAQSGTTGQNLPIEAIQIKLSGTAAKQYDIYYRVHAAYIGWLGWAKNGASAGSTGCALQTEAIQVRLVKKGAAAPGSTATPYLTKPTLKYRSHVAGVGWLGYVGEDNVSGSTGQERQMEAVTIKLSDLAGGNGIQYRAHIQDQGWSNWVDSGKNAGTTGLSRRLEAIQIRLVGNNAKLFNVFYRVHVQNYGWLGWAANGEKAGTEGGCLRAEAIQIKLLLKTASINRGGPAFHDLTNVPQNNSGTLTSPVPSGCKFSKKTQDNGYYIYHDINRNVSTSTPVYAITDGTVVYKQAYTVYSGTKYLTSYGNFIQFTSADRVYTAKYCHLNQFVGASQKIPSSRTRQKSGSSGTENCGSRSVRKGEVIGYIGMTGNASGVHLHFEITKNGTRIDPTSLIGGLT